MYHLSQYALSPLFYILCMQPSSPNIMSLISSNCPNHISNMPAITNSNFAPGAATQQLNQTWHRLTSYWCHHLAILTKHNVMFVSAPLALLCEKMTSSTKPEVHNTLHCCQRRTKPWPQTTSTCMENIMKFGRVVFMKYVSRETDIQTMIATLCTHSRGKVI